MPRKRKRKVKEPLTEELLQELLNASDFEQYTEKLPVGNRRLSDYLQQILDEKGLNRAEVIRNAGINNTFGYEIFTGRKENPSRDYVLQLAFAMAVNLKTTNRLLQAARVNELYCKNRRDAIIIFSLNKGYSLQKTDEELYRFGEKTIC